MDARRTIFINGRYRGRPVTGVERYAHETVAAFGRPFQFAAPRRAATGLAGHLWEQLVLPGRVGDGVLWSPANTGPLAVAGQVLTIHDLGPLDHPEWYRPLFAAWYRWLWPRLAARVRTVAAVSAFTRRRLTERLGLREDRIPVAPNGVDPAHFFPRPESEIAGMRTRYSLPDRYVLFIGTVQPRKNLSGLAEAFVEIWREDPGLELVAAGGGRSARAAEVLPGVRFLGRVPDPTLPALYSGAQAFVQPSFYEGGALTMLEAMACGCPVAAARGSALEEYAGEAARLFDPGDPAAIASAVRSLTGAESRRRELREAGLARARTFTWQRTAEAVEAALAAIGLRGSP